MKPTLLSRKEAAAYLGKHVTTIRDWKIQGRGPAYYKIGRHVMYSREDLDEYIASCREDPKLKRYWKAKGK